MSGCSCSTGFNSPPAIVGQVLPNSPAQTAGLEPGDRVVAIGGKEIQDFTKLRMNTALLRSDEPVEFTVDRPGIGQLEKPIVVYPAKNTAEYGMSSIGMTGGSTLQGPKEDRTERRPRIPTSVRRHARRRGRGENRRQRGRPGRGLQAGASNRRGCTASR
ncbi:MAG: PDZ domain-containing protein [Tepidisphaeraceae bacterium]